jgi:hypothetical protein
MSLLQRSVRVAASRLAQVAHRTAPVAVAAAPKMMHASASRAQAAAAAPAGRLHPSEDLSLPQIQVRHDSTATKEEAHRIALDPSAVGPMTGLTSRGAIEDLTSPSRLQ